MAKEKQGKLVAVELSFDLLKQLEEYWNKSNGNSKSAVIRTVIKKY